MKGNALKHIVLGMTIGLTVAGGTAYGAGTLRSIEVSMEPIFLVVNGQTVVDGTKTSTFFNGKTDVPLSLNYEGTTYVPLRFIGEAVGKNVKWENATNTITLTDKPDNSGNSPSNPAKPPIIAGELAASLKIDNGQFVFTVKNQTEQVKTFLLHVGHPFDYLINNEAGEKVLQYSDGKMFAQSIVEKTLKQGEEMTFTEPIPQLKPGTYTVDFWMYPPELNMKSSLCFQVK
ncbi:BsuPI-related putative proteinase inhibitor [Aneurinibacillus terranovensis]|uniref:BsuPI-related putative proteinase inhibitor n=1 Tax=Aneurinibacillus terranovensis TaxID=278991 RepID=UPI00040CF0E7|nr:BsuPI-related putative proteinase inhibitor [Aneurinibacillus terranovensis]